MHDKKKFIEDLKLKGLRVLTRVDFNVPLNENLQITDNSRIKGALQTIKYIIENDGKVVLMSHLGRPGGCRSNNMSLKPVAEELSELLGKKVTLAPDCIGEEVERIVNRMQNGEVVLLENLRFHKGEIKNDTEFCKKLAKMGDLYVNDAFGIAHRAHASTSGVVKYIQDSAVGYLISKELKFLGGVLKKPEKPFVAILGGAKVSDKIKVVDNLLDRVQTLIIGGGMSCTFLQAQGFRIGASLLEEDSLDFAAEIIKKSNKKRVKLLLPRDALIAQSFDDKATIRIIKLAEGVPEGWKILDIGPLTEKLFCESLSSSRTVFWNGPMGVFEMKNFSHGTFAIAKSIAERTERGAVSIIGGGDSVAAIKKAGLGEKITHVSTGGGASLEFLEGRELPGVRVIKRSN